MQLEFRSDNAAGTHPRILAALAEADEGSALAYGGDHLSTALESKIREVFEHDTARVFPVSTGTAANALALSAICPPWGAVLCHEGAHIINAEGGSTSMFAGGAVMQPVGGADGRIDPSALQGRLAVVRWGDPHESQPSALSITQATEVGTVYEGAAIAELAAIANGSGLRVHLDGARIANALAAVGGTPADLTWRAGIDVVTLGAIKNGGLSTEAIVAFDGRAAEELVYRTKRAGHVTPKMRYAAAQLLAYLEDGLWLQLARHANEQAARLAEGLTALGVRLQHQPQANLLFVEMGERAVDALEGSGMLFYRLGPTTIRLVTSWQTGDGDVDGALEAVAVACRA